jgi:hypothetical protein
MNCNEILVKETNEEKKKSFHIRQCQWLNNKKAFAYLQSV